ncbi:MAG: hypothetical protein ABIN97_18030 [Ginsengibacter sp.]
MGNTTAFGGGTCMFFALGSCGASALVIFFLYSFLGAVFTGSFGFFATGGRIFFTGLFFDIINFLVVVFLAIGLEFFFNDAAFFIGFADLTDAGLALTTTLPDTFFLATGFFVAIFFTGIDFFCGFFDSAFLAAGFFGINLLLFLFAIMVSFFYYIHF